MSNNPNDNNKLANIPDFSNFNFGSAPNIEIQTTNGQTFTLPDDYGLTDLTTQSNGKPIGQLKIGQPGDDKDKYPNQFYVLEKERQVNQDTGAITRTPIYKLLGEKAVLYPVAILRSHLNRSMMPKYIPGAANTEGPLCRSENGIMPDARYAGKLQGINVQCAVIGPQGIKVVCPFAQWGDENPATHKKTPPPCGEQFPIFFAVSYAESADSEPEMLVCEAYFKSTSAQEGRGLVRELAQMQRKGIPLYSLEVTLIKKKTGPGLAFVPVYTPGQYINIPDEHVPGFNAAMQRAQEAVAMRLARAAQPVQDSSVSQNANAPATRPYAAPSVDVDNDTPLI